MRTPARGRKSAVYLRRSPFVVSYWLEGQLLFENYLTSKKIAASSETTGVLDFFSGWKPIEAMFRKWPEYSQESLLDAAGRLLKESMLEGSRRPNPPEDPRQKALRRWRSWNPAAGFFHMSTKDIYDAEISAAETEFIQQLAKSHPVPRPIKSYPKARVTRLIKSSSSSSAEFPGVLRARRTWREFSKKKVSSAVFGELLDLSFGIQAWDQVPNIGRLAQKTSPSGGSLHPTEAYVLVKKVEGIAPGIYHYDSGGHRLQLLRRGMTATEIQRDLAGQWWFRDAAFVVLLTAVFGRTQWKYDYARAYRAILIESGHLCQTFCLTATWLGLAPFCTIAVADTKIEQSLGIDGISESVIYALGAGCKPEKKEQG